MAPEIFSVPEAILHLPGKGNELLKWHRKRAFLFVPIISYSHFFTCPPWAQEKRTSRKTVKRDFFQSLFVLISLVGDSLGRSKTILFSVPLFFFSSSSSRFIVKSEAKKSFWGASLTTPGETKSPSSRHFTPNWLSFLRPKFRANKCHILQSVHK